MTKKKKLVINMTMEFDLSEQPLEGLSLVNTIQSYLRDKFFDYYKCSIRFPQSSYEIVESEEDRKI